MRVLVLTVPSPHESLSSGGPHVRVPVPTGETVAPPQNDLARRRSRLDLECLESREVPTGLSLTVRSNGDDDGWGTLETLTLRQALRRVTITGSTGELNTIEFALTNNTITIG